MNRLSNSLGIATMILALAGCGGGEQQKSPTVKKTLTDNFEATATTEHRLVGGVNYSASKHLHFSAAKKGAYLIESWKLRYRGNDKLDKIVSLEVTDLPFERRMDFQSDVYRVEVTYSNGHVIERDTINFPTKFL